MRSGCVPVQLYPQKQARGHDVQPKPGRLVTSLINRPILQVSAVPPTMGGEAPLSVQAQVPVSDTQGPTCPLSARASPSVRTQQAQRSPTLASCPRIRLPTAGLLHCHLRLPRVNWLRLEQLRTPQGSWAGCSPQGSLI